MFYPCFLFFIFILTIPARPYLSIYPSDLRYICRTGRTMSVDDRSDIGFSITQGTLPWQPISVGLVHTTVYSHRTE